MHLRTEILLGNDRGLPIRGTPKAPPTMRRLTISIDDDLADTFERLMKKRVRTAQRRFATCCAERWSTTASLKAARVNVSAALSYVYNHHERQLASRLAQMQHDHHDVTVSTMHAHLDHDNCIETVILRG